MQNFLIIISSVLLNAAAQLFIKKGMSQIGAISFNILSILNLIIKAITNLPIWLGMGSYAISILLWMVVLSRVNVSYAYPFLSIGYIFTAFMAWFMFNEPMTTQKIIGIGIICLGIVILGTSKV